MLTTSGSAGFSSFTGSGFGAGAGFCASTLMVSGAVGAATPFVLPKLSASFRDMSASDWKKFLKRARSSLLISTSQRVDVARQLTGRRLESG